MILGLFNLLFIIGVTSALVYLIIVYVDITNKFKKINVEKVTEIKLENRFQGILEKVPTFKPNTSSGASVSSSKNDAEYYCCQNVNDSNAFIRSCDGCNINSNPCKATSKDSCDTTYCSWNSAVSQCLLKAGAKPPSEYKHVNIALCNERFSSPLICK